MEEIGVEPIPSDFQSDASTELASPPFFISLFQRCKDIENVFNSQIFLLFLRLFSAKKFSDIIVIDSIFPIINQRSNKSTTYM